MASRERLTVLVVEDKPSRVASHCPRSGSKPLGSAIRHALSRLSESADGLEAELVQLEAAFRVRARRPVEWGRRLGVAGLLPLLMLGNAELPAATAYAQEAPHER